MLVKKYRYRVVAHAINVLMPEKEHVSILEVGGWGSILQDYLPDKYEVTTADIQSPVDVVCDARDLPYDDFEFDVVCSLELLPQFSSKHDRLKVIIEQQRVGKTAVIYTSGIVGHPDYNGVTGNGIEIPLGEITTAFCYYRGVANNNDITSYRSTRRRMGRLAHFVDFLPHKIGSDPPYRSVLAWG